ncbi:Smr/MutS family protein [bacterium]|nr:Smr/MutS family protein [bacterium]NUP94285.1 Smr/MutS family protein [Candidatus Omnitrophota bacterium]
MKRTSRRPTHAPSLEVDLHGLHADQAEQRILQILDMHCGRQGLDIRFIHGKGSRILEGIVDRIGRSDPRVASVVKHFFNSGMTSLILSGQTKTPPRRALSSEVHLLHPVPPVRKKKKK